MIVPQLIMLVAENNLEAFYIEQALSEEGYAGCLRIGRRFDEVCCYFNGTGIYQNRQHHPFPQLIILDLATAEALHIVKWIRTNFAKEIPIIGIGTSQCHQLVQLGFDLGVNAYVCKEEGYDILAELILNMEFVLDRSNRSQTPKPISELLRAVTLNPLLN